MNDEKYFSHAWSLLTRDKGWFKPILVMAAARLVPIAGYLGNQGYIMEWARLTAWGVDSAPKQKNVDVGKCMASGWRAFVVSLGIMGCYTIAASVLIEIAGLLPDALGDLLQGLLQFANSLLGIVMGVAVIVAQIRAAIYESIGAGYRIDRVIEMIKRDMGGFFKVALISLAAGIVLGIVITIMILVILAMFIPVVMSASAGISERAIMSAISQSIGGIVLFGILIGYALSLLFIVIEMLTTTCVALWMRQFDVAQWGRSEDPLPASAPQPGAQNGPAPVYGQVPHTQSQPTSAPEPAYEPQPTPEDVTDSEPIPAPEPVLTPEPVPAPEPVPSQEPEVEQVVASAEEPSIATAKTELLQRQEPALDSEPDKDVDELYADLYDVIQRNNHMDK